MVQEHESLQTPGGPSTLHSFLGPDSTSLGLGLPVSGASGRPFFSPSPVVSVLDFFSSALGEVGRSVSGHREQEGAGRTGKRGGFMPMPSQRLTLWPLAQTHLVVQRRKKDAVEHHHRRFS